MRTNSIKPSVKLTTETHAAVKQFAKDRGMRIEPTIDRAIQIGLEQLKQQIPALVESTTT